MSDPAASVREWLARSGFPLEFEAARAFDAAGFAVHQGLHLRTASEGLPREVDVLAVRELLRAQPRPTRVTALRVIECKAAQAPWVILRGDQKGGKWEALGHLPLHPLRAEHILEVLELDDDPILLQVPSAPGFRAVAADPKSHLDTPYEAMAQVVGAARALVADNNSLIPTIAFPTVVINAPLFTLRYREGGEAELRQIESDRVVWSGHPDGGTTVVDIVTRPALPTFAAADASAMPQLLEVLYKAWITARAGILEAEHERRATSRRPSRIGRMLAAITGRD